MGRRFAWVLAAAATLGLAGCASMSPQQCLVANWGEQGYSDGRNGYPLTRLMAHRQACAEVGIAPDPAFYRQGWDQGVFEYCTPANGMAQGRAGHSYRNVCPPQLEGAFVYWHQLGRNVYEAQRQVDDLNREADQLQRRMRKEDDARKRRNLQRDLGNVERRLRDARRDLSQAQARLR